MKHAESEPPRQAPLLETELTQDDLTNALEIADDNENQIEREARREKIIEYFASLGIDY